jgi:hypothetical protein
MKFSHIIILSVVTLSVLSAGCSQSNTKREINQTNVDSVAVFSQS